MVTELVIYVFRVFISIIGGTPDKRISEGLTKCFFGFYRHYRRDPCRTYFRGSNLPFVFFVLGFIGIIGGTPDKRISEGLFCPLCFFLGFGIL